MKRPFKAHYTPTASQMHPGTRTRRRSGVPPLSSAPCAPIPLLSRESVALIYYVGKWALEVLPYSKNWLIYKPVKNWKFGPIFKKSDYKPFMTFQLIVYFWFSSHFLLEDLFWVNPVRDSVGYVSYCKPQRAK